MLIIIGTAAEVGKGGISTALPGYFEAIECADINYHVVVSHKGGNTLQKLKLYMQAMQSVVKAISLATKNNHTPVLYVHIGPWFSMLRKLSFAWVGKFMGAKVICQVHSNALDRYLDNAYGRLVCKLFFSQMDRILVLTEWWRSRLADVGVENLTIVPNPLSVNFEQIARQSRIYPEPAESGKPVQLLTMTRLVPGKGVELAIQSLALLPDQYQLTIAGAGPLRVELEKMVLTLGLAKRVSFLGWVEGESRLALFRSHDIFVLPSQNDSFGMGFVEAMAFGLPVVALDWGAIADVVPNDQAGFLVEHPDAALLAAALVKLESIELRQKMGTYGKQWVLQQFSVEAVAIRLGAVVNSLQEESTG